MKEKIRRPIQIQKAGVFLKGTVSDGTALDLVSIDI
jgi:hypothetical protein